MACSERDRRIRILKLMRRRNLSPGELGRARGLFLLFAVLNVIAFTLLSGNIITLYALRLGAGNLLVGVLSSFMYSAYIFLFVGRRIAPKWGMIRLMGRFWTLRYLLMLPILASPFFAARGGGPSLGGGSRKSTKWPCP